MSIEKFFDKAQKFNQINNFIYDGVIFMYKNFKKIIKLKILQK